MAEDNNQLIWPPFLDQLDSCPDRAYIEFYRFATAALELVPPRAMRDLTVEEREDLFQEIILHCINDSFRVLRKYADKGKPFAAWLYRIADNQAIDYLRKKARLREVDLVSKDGEYQDLETLLQSIRKSTSIDIDLKQLLTIVRKAINHLQKYCRLLLEMAADEFRPREMVLALRLSSEQNKKVSDDLRECRKKLVRLLAEGGIDIRSMIGE